MGNGTAALVAAATAVLGVALVAVLVSKNAQTPQVIGATATGFANIVTAATAPVTGQKANLASQGFGAL